ncbi:hypothetical protein L7F22_018837 [Adiantum nelumboides]|nr:hypothetical protein [Adiantum nelumboides]
MDMQGWDLNSDFSEFDNDNFIPSSQLEHFVLPPLADGVLVHAAMPYDRLQPNLHASISHSLQANRPRPPSTMGMQPPNSRGANSLPQRSLLISLITLHPPQPLQRAYNFTQAEMGWPRTTPPMPLLHPPELHVENPSEAVNGNMISNMEPSVMPSLLHTHMPMTHQVREIDNDMEVDINDSVNGASQALDGEDVQVDCELAEEQERGSFSQDNWDAKETDVLVAAKLEMDDIIEHGGLAVKMRTKKHRWDDIAQICVRSNVHHTRKQCMSRWNRVFREWKIIFDYECHISSGHGSYWQLNVRERRAKKLPTSFTSDMFSMIKVRYGDSKAINSGNGLFDTSSNGKQGKCVILVAHGDAASTHATTKEQGENTQGSSPPELSEGASTKKERTSGHKRKHPARLPIGNDLEEVNLQLVDWFKQLDVKRIA